MKLIYSPPGSASGSKITKLIKHLKPNKSPGYDFISTKAIQHNLDWWSVLAVLFTYIDYHAKVPDD